MARTGRGRPRTAAAQTRRRDRIACRGTRARRIGRHRPSDPRHADARRAAHGRDLSLLRRDGRQAAGTPGAGGSRVSQLRRARAPRRGGAGRAVEVHELEDGTGAGRGQLRLLKPAELTPLSSLKVAELMREVGFPPGVANVVPGYGNVAGQYLAEHPRVQKIAFTG